MFSKEYDVSKQFCLSFSYFMNGDSVGTLELRQIIKSKENANKPLWGRTGHQSKTWRTQRIELNKKGTQTNINGTFHVNIVVFLAEAIYVF